MDYLTWILGFLGAIMLGLVKDEVSAWIPRLARWCVCWAADRMPDRERSREEWLAHLEECPGKLSQLAHALGILGVGQGQRVRFWAGALRYLPGVRWVVFDSFITFVGMIFGGFFLYNWHVSSGLASIFASASLALAVLSYFTGRRAAKHLLHDREIIKFLIAYRKDMHL